MAVIALAAKTVTTPKITRKTYPPALKRYRFFFVCEYLFRSRNRPETEAMIRKSPRMKYRLRRKSWVESVKSWIVPATYRNRDRKHIRKKKIARRFTRRYRSFSFDNRPDFTCLPSAMLNYFGRTASSARTAFSFVGQYSIKQGKMQ